MGSEKAPKSPGCPRRGDSAGAGWSCHHPRTSQPEHEEVAHPKGEGVPPPRSNHPPGQVASGWTSPLTKLPFPSMSPPIRGFLLPPLAERPWGRLHPRPSQRPSALCSGTVTGLVPPCVTTMGRESRGTCAFNTGVFCVAAVTASPQLGPAQREGSLRSSAHHVLQPDGTRPLPKGGAGPS